MDIFILITRSEGVKRVVCVVSYQHFTSILYVLGTLVLEETHKSDAESHKLPLYFKITVIHSHISINIHHNLSSLLQRRSNGEAQRLEPTIRHAVELRIIDVQGVNENEDLRLDIRSR